MANVGAPGTLAPSSLQCGGVEMKVNSGIIRKTPSELRGEQLRRKNVSEIVNESYPGVISDSSGESHELKKPDIHRNPRYIEAHMDEVYPAKKCRVRMLAGKENAKEYISTGQAGNLRNLSLNLNLTAKTKDQVTGLDTHTSSKVAKDDTLQGQRRIEKCSQNLFRSVSELSSRGERLSDLDTVDMDKALKGLVTCESSIVNGSHEGFSGKKCNQTSVNPSNFYSKCQILMPKAPLDLTLKTSVRIISSFSLKWFHRLLNCGAYYMMPQFKDQNINFSSGSTMSSSSSNVKGLHSWVYPQSLLPASLISTLTLSAKDAVDMDFLNKRQAMWEDAFRSLYYMLRKNVCHIFYVCTSHFVVMFTADGSSGRTRHTCNAYLSQSSRLLRSLFKEHDVFFSMPLCHSNVEQVTAEDLVELSEIEKHNLGQSHPHMAQTRRVNSLCDIDNSPQSLLAFSGNKNVQGLYELLLNYRSSMTFLAGMDVPVLYSPVPFQNAALSTPEVQYVETKTTDQISASAKEPDPMEPGSIPVPSARLCCSIEFKDAYLPPWFISSLYATVCSEGKSFEASFTTEPTSVGLNIALKSVGKNSDSPVTGSESWLESNCTFGIPETNIAPNLYSSTLEELKYCNGSFTAFLLPI